MKNQINPTQVTSEAYRILFNPYRLIMGRKPKLDRRYKVNKAILAEFSKLEKSVDTKEAIAKRKQRHANKPKPFTNVLSNPLVLDHKRNGGKVVNGDHLRFGDGRNHWAKNDFDKKILAVLAKYQ